jgi:hypothetical protein
MTTQTIIARLTFDATQCVDCAPEDYDAGPDFGNIGDYGCDYYNLSDYEDITPESGKLIAPLFTLTTVGDGVIEVDVCETREGAEKALISELWDNFRESDGDIPTEYDVEAITAFLKSIDVELIWKIEEHTRLSDYSASS